MNERNEAWWLGQESERAGNGPAPTAELWALIGNVKVGEPRTKKLLKAFNAGWTASRLETN